MNLNNNSFFIIFYYTNMLQPYITNVISRHIVFYSITTISSIIMSTQNITKFIMENNSNDYKNYQLQMEQMDLINKLNITNSLMKDIYKRYAKTKEEQKKLNDVFELTTTSINTTLINEFELVQCDFEMDIVEPIQLALHAMMDIMQKINATLDLIAKKINVYNQSYFRGLQKIHISNEINQITHYNELFDKRYQMLVQLMQVYRV